MNDSSASANASSPRTLNSRACFSASRVRSFFIFSICLFILRPISRTVSFTLRRATSIPFSTSFFTEINIRSASPFKSSRVPSVKSLTRSSNPSSALAISSYSSLIRASPSAIIWSMVSLICSIVSSNRCFASDINSFARRLASSNISLSATSTLSMIPPIASFTITGISSTSVKNRSKLSSIVELIWPSIFEMVSPISFDNFSTASPIVDLRSAITLSSSNPALS